MDRSPRVKRRVACRDGRALHQPSALLDDFGETAIGRAGDRQITQSARAVRTRRESGRAHVSGHVDDGQPHRHGEIGIERPVVPILMPRRAIGAGGFEQRLIVIQADRRSAQKLCRDSGPSLVEHDAPRRFVHAPDVRHLREELRIVVDASLLVVLTCHIGHDLLNHRTIRSDLFS